MLDSRMMPGMGAMTTVRGMRMATPFAPPRPGRTRTIPPRIRPVIATRAHFYPADLPHRPHVEREEAKSRQMEPDECGEDNHARGREQNPEDRFQSSFRYQTLARSFLFVHPDAFGQNDHRTDQNAYPQHEGEEAGN